jgi:uncharacterized Zn-finger protein
MSVTSPPDSTQPVETIYVDDHRVACDGGGGALGHPKVWYEMGDEGKVECLYCGRVYIKKDGADAH